MTGILSQIAERLGTVEGLAQVGDEIDFLDAQAAIKRTPAAFVVEESEEASTVLRSGVVRITRNPRIAIVLVIAKAGLRRDRTGAAEGLRADIRAALTGFRPDGASRALLYRATALRQLEAGLAAWQISFDVEVKEQGQVT